MKRTFQLTLGLGLLAASSAAFAADWDVSAVSKQSSAVPNAAAATEEAGKFLHVKVDVTGEAPNWNKFKVVDEQGEQVATPAGYNPKQSVVVFEGDWTNMIGRYLENGETRIPLFQKEAPVDAAPEAVVVKEEPVQQPVVVDQPVVRVEEPVVVDRDPVVIDRDPVVVRDRVDTVHVYDDDRDHVVVHHDGDRVVHHGGGHVVHHGDGVHHVHHGDGDVHHVHHGDGDVHHGSGDGVAVADDDHGHGAGGVGGDGAGAGDGALAKASPWDIDPLGRTLGMAGTVAMGDTAGVGGFGAGYGVGYGYGAGSGTGAGPGAGPGAGDGSGEGCGCGDGSGAEGCGDGPGADGSGETAAENAEGPEEGPNPAEPRQGDAPGMGPGNGNGNSMSNLVNLAPQYKQRVRNLAPKMKLPKMPTYYGPDLLVYNPQIPYWNPNLPYFNPGYGYGGGGGYGDGTGSGTYPEMPNLSGVNLDPVDRPTGLILYISCGDEKSPGKVYQVDEQGRVLGVVNLPFSATGLALHREQGLVASSPREGGKVYYINDGGIVEPIIEKDDQMAHPVDIATMPNGDSMVIADDMTNTLSLTNVQGKQLDTYKKLDGLDTGKDMSVAIGHDRAILYSSDAEKGVYRFQGNSGLLGSTPVLPESGAVASDPGSDKWAATQGTNQIALMDGNEQVATFELPPGKSFYGKGHLSFAPPAGIEETAPNSGVVTVMRDSDSVETMPHLMEFKATEDGIDRRLMFEWDKEPILDFVVGPRMLWEQNHRETYKGVY